ncbi:MAG: hypothetical protein WCJ64_12835, partial [Rhodospirillaceae bacterium]
MIVMAAHRVRLLLMATLALLAPLPTTAQQAAPSSSFLDPAPSESGEPPAPGGAEPVAPEAREILRRCRDPLFIDCFREWYPGIEEERERKREEERLRQLQMQKTKPPQQGGVGNEPPPAGKAGSGKPPLGGPDSGGLPPPPGPPT